jgi:hypothetical protein
MSGPDRAYSKRTVALILNFMELPSGNWSSPAAPMLNPIWIRRARPLVSASLGGFAAFCVIHYWAPNIAAQALILLGGALTVGHYSRRP